MSRTCCGEAGGAIRRRVASFKGSDALALAASPTFILMALWTGVLGSDPADTLCSAAHGSRFSGMATMYFLMSAFHVTPWVRVMRG